MDAPRQALTPALQKEICAFIRQGAFPDVAAEAAGLPQTTFRRWLARGARRSADAALRTFAGEVRKAAAQARVLAEMETVKKNPLAWLKHGPGKETADMAGWTVPVRARFVHRRGINLLAQPELANLFGMLLRVLVPFPDARAAVVEALTSLPALSQKPTATDAPPATR